MDALIAINCHIPITLNVDFMGTLENRINTLLDTTDPLEAKKCIKYIELYAKIAVMKDALLGQTAALIPKQDLRRSIFNVQESLRLSAKALFQFLYNSDPKPKGFALLRCRLKCCHRLICHPSFGNK